MATTEELLHDALEQNQELLKQIQQLNETIAYLTNKLFGRHSEKMEDPNQQLLFEEDGVFTEPEQTGEQSEQLETVVGGIGKTRSRKRTRSEIISDSLPVEEELHESSEEHCINGHNLEKIGKHFVRQEVRLIPGRLYVANIYDATYKCSECDKNDSTSQLYQGGVSPALIPHSIASASLVSEVAYLKFVLGTPFYRQMDYWSNQGLKLSDKSMGNWIITCAQKLKPVYNLLHDKLIANKFLQGDETPYQVLQEPGKKAESKSYIWLARTIGRAKNQIVYYFYSPSRAGKVAQELYSGFTGTLQCDGYSGYNAISNSVEHVGCWAHVRRKFFDDANLDKNNFKPSIGLELINKMMKLEQSWKNLDGIQRLHERQKLLKPLITDFWAWCDNVVVLPKDRLGKAIAYAQGQRASLNRVLDYGEIDLTNNASERNMKSYVIGRKNWLFSTSPKGAEANAIWMSLIQSAKANGVNVRNYIEFLLSKIASLPIFAKDVDLEAYLPWNYEV